MVTLLKTKCILAVLVATLGVLALPALAGFVGGVETFDGTVLDTATWEQYGVAGTSFTQNDALTINGAAGNVDYTTTAVTLAVGQAVSVEVTITSAGASGIAALFLTNDSGGTTLRTQDDSEWWSVYGSFLYDGIYAYDSAGSAPVIVSGDPPLNQKQIYRIDRTGATTATFTVYAENGTVLGSVAATGLPAFTSDPFISLASPNATTTFDNVRIMNTTDPQPFPLPTVDTPTFDPDGGAAPATVTISCATSGATIYYTTDGSAPSESNGTVIASGGTVTVSSSLVLKAKAFKTGFDPSLIKSAAYSLPSFPGGVETFDGTVLDTATWEQYGVAGTSFTQNDALTINGAAGNADYTTTVVTLPVGKAVSVEVTITSASSTGIVALALTNNSIGTTNRTFNDSEWWSIYGSFQYDGTYAYDISGTQVPMIVSGDPPTNQKRIYRIDRTGATAATFKVMAADGRVLGSVNLTGLPAFTSDPFISLVSNLATTTFDNVRIMNAGEEPTAPVTFSPAAGVYDTAQSVTLSCITPGATIYYTTDGSDPTDSSTEYTAPVSITSTTTLKARAYADGLLPSVIRTAEYQFATTVPSFSPDGGMFAGSVDVTISCTTPGSTIKYTTDGTDPSDTNGTVIANGGTVNITSTTTLKAKAWSSLDPSPIKSASYTIPRPALIPSGTADIDGDLSDWEGAEWAPLDQVYSGTPSDIAEGYYAAKWQSDTVYVAVKVRDTAHILANGFVAYNTQDGVEFFIHTTNPGTPDYSSTQVSAQQYAVGITNSDPNAVWTNMTANGPLDIPISANFRADGMKVDEWLYYEAAITPFEIFDKGGVNMVMSPLSVGQVIGLDVVAVGRNGSGYTGGRSENTLTGKYNDWTKFGLHRLASAATPVTIAEAKTAAEGAGITISGIVSAVFGDYFYVENTDRTYGIRVNKASHGRAVGQAVSVTGTVGTLASGERYVSASSVSASGTGEIEPLGMNNKALGGGDSGTLPNGQVGVAGGTGLNNIGLLVKTTGKVGTKGTGWFMIDDGSGVSVKVIGNVPTGTPYVSVTGISSLETGGARVILATSDAQEFVP